MKRLGRSFVASSLFLLSVLIAQAFGLNASILPFGIVHLTGFGLVMTWWWLDESWTAAAERSLVALHPSQRRRIH